MQAKGVVRLQTQPVPLMFVAVRPAGSGSVTVTALVVGPVPILPTVRE